MLFRYFWLAALVAVAGCSGGSAFVGPGAPPGNRGAATADARVAITLTIPAQSTALYRKRYYISSGTLGIGVSERAAGGAAFPAATTPDQTFDVSADSALCASAGSGSRVCTITVPAQPGSDDFQVTAWNATPSGGSFAAAKALSSATVLAQPVALGAANTIRFSLSGIVTSIELVLSDTTLPVGTAATTTLSVLAFDASGDLILGPGGYADAAGNPLSIALTHTDEGDGKTALSSTTLGEPADTGSQSNAVTVTYSGGQTYRTIFTAKPSEPIAGYNSAASLSYTNLAPLKGTKAAIDSYIESLSSSIHAVQIGISYDYQPAYLATYGNKSISSASSAVPATNATTFQIGSVTKQFTDASILKLIEEGKIASVDTSIVGLVPEYTSAVTSGSTSYASNVSYRHIMSMASGIDGDNEVGTDQPNGMPYDPSPCGSSISTTDVASESVCLSHIASQYYDPKRFLINDYSNPGIYMAGIAIQRAMSAPSYENALRSLALSPLNLASTHVLSLPADADYATAQDPNLADGYGFAPPNKGYNPSQNQDASQLEGAGALVSNCSDLLGWLRHLFRGEYIDMADLTAMTTPAAGVETSSGGASKYGYGLYTFTNSDGSTYAILHNGKVEGFQAVDMNFGVVGSTTSYQIVVLTNNDDASVPTPTKIAEQIYKIITGIAPPAANSGTPGG